MAHKALPFNEHYEDALRELVKGLVPPYGIRRMVIARVIEMDPWIAAGGPALAAVGDVAVEEEHAAEWEIFSSLLGLDRLFDWATEPFLPGV
ncbi:hypothetical protein [Absidia glauca]|uniref:Uncharacterized protein n=1 Tax=Absidia glauca TaxID=4829 RepID=A0A168PMA5_ABSGL|nr:hypothetical protein [Absidia glauca]